MTDILMMMVLVPFTLMIIFMKNMTCTMGIMSIILDHMTIMVMRMVRISLLT